MDILIGTKNQYKATEMACFLDNYPEIKIHFLEDLSLKIKVDENQPTLRKNAEKKAIEISKLTDWHVLASDGGIDISGLGEKKFPLIDGWGTFGITLNTKKFLTS